MPDDSLVASDPAIGSVDERVSIEDDSGSSGDLFPIFVVQVLVGVAILGLWQLTAVVFGMQFWTSSPVGVAKEAVRWIENGTLWEAVRVTLMEAGVGFVLGGTAGAIVGFAFGWMKRLGEIFQPFIVGVYSVPKIALAPLFVLWFGIGPVNKMAFSTLLVFFLVFFTTFEGTKDVDPDLLDNARVMGASQLQIVRKFVLPHAAVWMFTGLRMGLPYAIIGAVVGEFVAANKGLGFEIKAAAQFLNTAGVFVGIFALALVSISLLAVLKRIERRVLKWKDPGQTNIVL